jgi:signal transduction histidine kinase
MGRPSQDGERAHVDSERPARLEEELLRVGRELHRLARENEALRERLRLERADREEMLATAGHELRTPLTVIRGFHRLLLGGEAGPLTAEQRRFLEESLRSCEKLDAFVEKVLDAAREPGAGAVLEVASAPLLPVIQAACDSLRSILAERGLSVVVGVEERLCARFDAGALDRVLLNLLGNAARFARSRVEIAARELGVEGRAMVEVSVADDGPGVAPADRERVFEPWVQAAGAAGGGLGLGLAICRRLVEAHGGRIAVSACRSGGSRFAFTLPGAGQ